MNMKRFNRKLTIFLFVILAFILSTMASKEYNKKNTAMECYDTHLKYLEKEGYPIVRYSLINRYPTGCVSLDQYNIRDKKILLRGSTPSAWDWRYATYKNITGDWTTPVRYQDGCGSCWDFAAMGALESIINIRAKNPNLNIDLSEQYLLSCPSNSGGCSGWNAYWAYLYLYYHGGAIPEDCFPYTANDRIPCSEKCSNWREKLLPITGYGSLANPDRDYLKKMIVNFGPVVAEMAVYSDFGFYKGGVYKHPGEEPVKDINHQVVIVGYDDSQHCWICKNSWGTNWGENGWFRIAYGDCQIEHYIVYANFSPAIANADGPYYGKTGEKIKFDGEKSYSMVADIINYTWNFGDGSYGYGKYVYHAYSKEGRYYIRLTITDEKGNKGTYKTNAYIDNTPPNLEIKRPKKQYIYLFNEERCNIPIGTIIMGNITISAFAEDEISGLDRIELYIDNLLVNKSKQLEWNWQDGAFGFHILGVKAFDMAGNEADDRIVVFTWM